jgi:hypothetical protein
LWSFVFLLLLLLLFLLLLLLFDIAPAMFKAYPPALY